MATGELTALAGVLAQQAITHDLPARDLEPAELQDLVATIASDTSTWGHLVGFDDRRRTLRASSSLRAHELHAPVAGSSGQGVVALERAAFAVAGGREQRSI